MFTIIASFFSFDLIYLQSVSFQHSHSEVSATYGFNKRASTMLVIVTMESNKISNRSTFAGGCIGLVRDPSLQGNKELYLLYSREFQSALKLSRQKICERSEFEKLLRHLMPKILSTRSFCDPDFEARCALFGPGIESARTKHLVHRVVNAHDDLFEAKGFVPGLPGKQ